MTESDNFTLDVQHIREVMSKFHTQPHCSICLTAVNAIGPALDRIEELEADDKEAWRQVARISAENAKLREALENAEREVDLLQGQWDRENMRAINAESRIRELESRLAAFSPPPGAPGEEG